MVPWRPLANGRSRAQRISTAASKVEHGSSGLARSAMIIPCKNRQFEIKKNNGEGGSYPSYPKSFVVDGNCDRSRLTSINSVNKANIFGARQKLNSWDKRCYIDTQLNISIEIIIQPKSGLSMHRVTSKNNLEFQALHSKSKLSSTFRWMPEKDIKKITHTWQGEWFRWILLTRTLVYDPVQSGPSNSPLPTESFPLRICIIACL